MHVVNQACPFSNEITTRVPLTMIFLTDDKWISAWKPKKSKIMVSVLNLDTLTLNKNTYDYLIVEKFSSKL